jgi:perosamine synthetase
MIPAFRDTPEAKIARERNRNAYSISPYGINLPSALALDEFTVEHVCVILRQEISALTPKASG